MISTSDWREGRNSSHDFTTHRVSVLWLCDLQGDADKVNKYDFLFRFASEKQ